MGLVRRERCRPPMGTRRGPPAFFLFSGKWPSCIQNVSLTRSDVFCWCSHDSQREFQPRDLMFWFGPLLHNTVHVFVILFTILKNSISWNHVLWIPVVLNTTQPFLMHSHEYPRVLVRRWQHYCLIISGVFLLEVSMHMFKYACLFMNVCMCACMRTQLCSCACMHAQICTFDDAYAAKYLYVYMCAYS